MIARLVTYRTESLDEAEAWARERAAALRAYKDSDAYQRAVREIADGWGVSAKP